MTQLFEFIGNHNLLFLEFIVVSTLLAWTFLQAGLQKFKQIAPLAVVNLINHEDAVVVDVREKNEYSTGHVINSLHIPLGSLSQHLKILGKNKQRAIVVACQSGSRSASACNTLIKNGFENLYNMKGGMSAWQSADLPTTKKSTTKK